MPPEAARHRLIALLQGAYSGELAAARAYRGHWRSIRDAGERDRIRGIEEDELRHRARVGEILAELGAGPAAWRELFFGALGSLLGVLCHLSGWLLPMYGAGALEERNVAEYAEAARLAVRAGVEGYCEELLEMSEAEHDHEVYFRERVCSHRLAAWVPMWPSLPPREEIRACFDREHPGVLAG